MAHRPHSRHAQQRSHRWMGAVAFSVLMVFSVSGILLGRVQSVAVEGVRGGSMAPLLRNGDAVVLAKTRAVAARDIISYRSPINPADILTRRVSAVDNTKDVVITKGDNAAKANAPFSESLVIGVARYHVAKLGYVIDFLRSPAGLVIGAYLPATIIVGLELSRLSRYYEPPVYHLPGYRIRPS